LSDTPTTWARINGATKSPHPPALDQFANKVALYGKMRLPDQSLSRFRGSTRPDPDLLLQEHRQALLKWLNDWGCRIRYPRPGDPGIFHQSLAGWWASSPLGAKIDSIRDIRDEEVDVLARSFGLLAALPVTDGVQPRVMGSTAAAKCMYVLRPSSVVPWDAKIAWHLHGARDSEAFAAHLRLARDWADALLSEACVEEDELSRQLGRSYSSMAKMLDEYWYVTITRGM
jgi:hypothetical protein